MKRIFTFTIILLALTACTAPQTQSAPDVAATDMPQASMPNPASVYCIQKGNKLEIRTAADGSQNGICVFPDGSTCDEWAYYRGECGLAAQKSPTPAIAVEATAKPSGGGTGGNVPGSFVTPGTPEKIADWWGIIKSNKPGAQFDDYFERQDLGQIIYFGIDSMDPAVKSQIKALRDSGKIVHLYGTLLSNVPDVNGSQIRVDRIVVQENVPGSFVTPGTTEKIANWWGIIKSNKPGAQFDDYFERRDLGQVISFGIDSLDPAVKSQIKALRDSGKIVHLYGTLLSNVPDVNGSQIQVDRIVVQGNIPGSFVTPGTTEKVADWWGIIKSNKPGAQFDDYFERRDLGQVISFGIDSLDPAINAQIKALRDSGKIVHLYGTLLINVPDVNGSQIQVDRIEVKK
jgi:putative hemolysin